MVEDLSKQRLALLGLGKMGSILLQALLKHKLFLPENSVATVRHPGRAKKLSDELGIDVGTDNRAAARNADIVLICVKPQTVPEVCEDVRAEVDPSKLVVSVAASVPTRSIEKFLSADIPVVRAMPNTPCSVGEGMIAISRGRFAEPHHLELSEQIFNIVGRTARIDEKHLDAVTGLSASGPAFIYIILESLAEAGVKLGLPREVATLLVAQTMLGSARQVLETGDHPALLKDVVTTPAGCTIDGIMELEEGKLRVTLIKAVVKAADRAKDLYEDD